MEQATTQPFLSTLSAGKYDSLLRKPNYWTSNPASLITICNVNDVILGTGASVYSSLQPLLESAESELVLVTCFWARSTSLTVLCDALRQLSAKAVRRGRKVRVRICVSSVSLWQKLFHTQSLDGYIYPPTAYGPKLGLPTPDELPGLEIVVKSIFVKPFSVMHPKFIIIDRQIVVLPSCNVSWEDWFEGCVGLQGKVVTRFVEFWKDFWHRADLDELALTSESHLTTGVSLFAREIDDQHTNGILPALVHVRSTGTPCVFLPSPHSINPKFRFPWQHAAPPPNTPLNVFLLASFKAAKNSIYIQTPNLTAPPVLMALLDALKRGINVKIVTSDRLMILEQLVTAGTTTSRCMKRLIKRYRRAKDYAVSAQYSDIATEEGRAQSFGHLEIEYYRPDPATKGRAAEPVQSHLKLTMVDSELVVLGSGNLDRASWYTSQELGLAIYEPMLSQAIRQTLSELLRTRTQLVYDSTKSGSGGR